MKKICVIGAALMLFTMGANAQVQVKNNDRNLAWGIEGGVTLNNLYHLQEDFQTSNMLKVGGYGGLVANIGTGRWSLQPGLRYIMKGAELESSGDNGVGMSWKRKDKLTFHYIELPVNIVWHSGNWTSNRFSIGLGGYASYLVNAQDKHKLTTTIEGVDVVDEGSEKLPVGDPYRDNNLRNYDLGLGGFLAYEMKSGLYIKAGAEVSLLDLQKSPTLGSFYERNYNFLGGIGYTFGYKCK
jgi:hypothetical protein